MRSLIRVAAGTIGMLALGVAAAAQSPSPSPEPSPSPSVSPYPLAALKPTAVVIHLAGGYHPVNRWLAYDADGTARFEGTLDFERGRFRSQVDFSRVEQILGNAEMCTRHSTIVRPATIAMDAFYYRVSVRCGNGWRFFTSGDGFERDGIAKTREAVGRLEQIASTLSWQRTDETAGPPDGGRIHLADPLQR